MSRLPSCVRSIHDACAQLSCAPFALVLLGASGVAAACAVVALGSAASPRWKGPPAFSEPDAPNPRCRHPTASLAPTATGGREAQTRLEPPRTPSPLRVEVEDADSPFRVGRSGEYATVYDFCTPVSPNGGRRESFSGLRSGSSGGLRHSWGGSLSSSVNTPTVLLSSCTSRHGAAGPMAADAFVDGETGLSEIEWHAQDVRVGGSQQATNALGETRQDPIHDTQEDEAYTNDTSHLLASTDTTRTRKVNSTAEHSTSNATLHAPRASPHALSDARQLVDGVCMPRGKLQQTLSHLVGTAVVAPSAGILSGGSLLAEQLHRLETRREEQLRHSMELYANTGVTPSSVLTNLTPTATRQPLPPRQGQPQPSEQTPHPHPEEPEVQPQTQTQPREVQPLSLPAQHPSTPPPTAPRRVPLTTLLPVSGAPVPQNDRRTDDVFVRHRSDGVASYSLSLTYHDAHGSSRTIDTHSLPPLRLPPRPRSGSSSTAVTEGTWSLRQSPSPAPSGRSQGSDSASSASRLLATSWHRREMANANANAKARCADAMGRTDSATTPFGTSSALCAGGDLAAPLPPLEPSMEPRLQGVAGRRGELRIGAFLGGGWCGKVYECLNTETGEFLAAKQLLFDPKDPKLRQRLKQLEFELEVLTLAAAHRMPWIVGFHGAEKRGHSALMYLEYCARGSLLDYVMSHGIPPPVPPPPSSVSAAAIADHIATYAARDGAGGSALSVSPECFSPPHLPPRLPRSQHQRRQEGESAAHASHPREVHSHEEEKSCRPHVCPAASPAGSYGASSCSSSSRSSRRGVPEMPILPLDEVQRLTRQILEALHFMHFHNYAHLDVKTANVLVTGDGEARLADFGCSMRLRRPIERGVSLSAAEPKSVAMRPFPAPCAADTKPDAVCAPPSFAVLAEDDAITELRGTALYMAPEMIRFERGHIGTPADVWSLGCVVMELATGAAPWSHVARDKLRVLYRIGSAREELPLPPCIVHAAGEARRWLARHQTQSREPSSPARSPRAGGEREAEGKRRRWERTRVSPEADLTEKMLFGEAQELVEGAQWSERHTRMLLFVALEDFLSRCLRIRPEDRFSCENLLRHPFLNLY